MLSSCHQIFRQLFFKESSAAEMGTSCASMNRTAKSNAKKGPEEDYNAFKDFVDRETEAHIISRWMVFAGMTDMKGIASYWLLLVNFLTKLKVQWHTLKHAQHSIFFDRISKCKTYSRHI